MEFDHSLCVLPSHGLPYSVEGGEKCESPPRALQLSSGNIGSVGSEPTFDILKPELGHQYRREEAPSLFSTPTTHAEGSLPRVGERRRRRQRRDTGSRQYPWQRDRNFIRYELDSERYRAYRLKTRQSNDQVWPDDVEECLQYALRVIPVLGRKKDARINYNNQQGGRNELIRDFIFKWTGKDLGRKQVSSHLQVLKSYLSDNRQWMQLVTPTEKGSKEPSFHRDHECDLQDVVTGLDKIGRHAYTYHASTHALPPPVGILGSNAPPSVIQVDFEMFLNDVAGERLHTFTSIQSDIGSGPRLLQDVSDWNILYPDLAKYHKLGHVVSELILLETNIDVLRDHPPQKSTLGIDPFIVVAGGKNFENWTSSTRLYEKGVAVRERRKGIKLDECPLRLKAEYQEHSDNAKVVLQMKSSWWANIVIAEILNRTTAARAHGDQRAVYEAEEWGRCFLAEMSMMQEIYASPKDDKNPQRIAILLWKFRQTEHGEAATTTWRKLKPPYPRSRRDSPACSPALPFLQAPMAMALDTSHPYELGSQRAVSDGGYLGQSSFFVDDPESIITGQLSKGNSSSSTPTPDLQSLPSSTATSFASSGSGSLHNDFHSGAPSSVYLDSTYLSHDWQMDPQQSVYPEQESEYLPDNVAYECPNTEYLSQRSIYPDPSEAYAFHNKYNNSITSYDSLELSNDSNPVLCMSQQQSAQNHYITEHESHPRVPEILSRHQSYDPSNETSFDFSRQGNSTIAQDFTGGQIQISFAEREQRQHNYDHSLVTAEGDILHGPQEYYNTQHEARDAAGLEPETSSRLEMSRQPSHYSASQDLENLDIDPGMELVTECQGEAAHEQAFLVDDTTHQPQQGELVLHHPQPHHSLLHHLDSAQWQTHALWAHIHKEAEEGLEEPSPTFSTKILKRPMSEEVSEPVHHELQEPGYIIGEISPTLERNIGDIERDVAREIRRDLGGVELGD